MSEARLRCLGKDVDSLKPRDVREIATSFALSDFRGHTDI